TSQRVVLIEGALSAGHLAPVPPEDHLIQPVIDELLPLGLARDPLLDHPAPLIVSVLVTELAEQGGGGYPGIGARSRGKHEAQVAEIIIHIIGAQAGAAAVPYSTQDDPVLLIPVFFHRAGNARSGVLILIAV